MLYMKLQHLKNFQMIENDVCYQIFGRLAEDSSKKDQQVIATDKGDVYNSGNGNMDCGGNPL